MELIRTPEVESIIKKYCRVRKQSLSICEPLLPEDHVVQPIVDVSPPKWHLGHTTWFFETFLLKNYYKGYKVFDNDFNFVFNSYYESIGSRLRRTDRGNLTRPSIHEIHEYRRYVDVFMKELLENIVDEKILEVTELGLQHEQQHQELLVTDIKYILGHNPLFPEYKKGGITLSPKAADINFLEVPAGMYGIGCMTDNFCFDNEQPAHKVFVESFNIADRLITNAEYLEFVNDGGYTDFRHWLMEGWEMVKAFKWEAPLYWIKKKDEWFEYTLGGLHEMDLNAPVTHVSFYEADAFAKWYGKRLLTEFEWEAAAMHFKPEIEKGNFLENGIFHPQSPNSGDLQLMGNAWEWTYSAYHPYPGYAREEGALGEYNGKFMINQMVLRGGSCATPKDHIRTSYRNFFHPDKRWQFTGIRLCGRD
jgi:ergothioneine biosynthesis protein EgtB